MNPIKVIYYRTYQFVLNKICLPFLKIKEAETIESDNCFDSISTLLNKNKYKRPLLLLSNHLLTDPNYLKFINDCQSNDIEVISFANVRSNPDVKQVDGTYNLYLKNGCDSLIAIGGGSILDLAKAVGILVSNKKKDISKYKGLLKVKKRLPFLILVPTTAGTGSETTICSVISDEEKNDKYSITDPKLIPDYAILDNTLLKTLPESIISTTGMDALTHAVEAFLGNALTKKTKYCATTAITLIYNNLYNFYSNKDDDLARKSMLKASYFAGVAFTRSYVGYVHALAHALGGKYHVAHGLANSILLPIVLKKYGKKAYKKLAFLADMLQLTAKSISEQEKAENFIKWIENLNNSMNIPSKFNNLIKKEDLVFLVNHAYKEANPLYPVIKELDKNELKEILIEAEETL